MPGTVLRALLVLTLPQNSEIGLQLPTFSDKQKKV